MEVKVCAGCGQEKSVTAFNYRVKAKGIRQRYCRDCTPLQLRSHYQRNTDSYLRKARTRNQQLKRLNQERLLASLKLHPCVRCGEADVVCLDFDHVRGVKKKAISAMLGYEWAAIEEEIQKCEVRCANCHRKKTARQRGYYKFYGRLLRP
jgi:hypothetical protein